MVIVVFFILHWYLSLFAQSFISHRYAAHGAFTMSKFWERFFYLYTYVAMGSSYLSPRAYGIMHRMHHAYTDTPKDPHSPKYFSNLFSMMNHTANIYSDIYKNRSPVDERFTRNLPDWPALDKWGHSWTSRILWIAAYLVFYIFYANSYWLYLLLPVHILMGPVHGAIINWFAHKYGYTNFKLDNTSRNLMPVDVFMLGEGYHNNHHKFASSINFGYRWYEIDPVYLVSVLFEKLGIISIKQTSRGRVASEF